MVAALDQFCFVPRHVVAEVVKAEFIIGAVRDVRGVLLPAHRGILVGKDATAGQAEETVDPAHEVRLVFGEVVVHGDDVDASAGQGVEVGRRGGHEGLAFTGLHFGDVAQVEGGATHELDVEVTHAQGAG